MPPRSSAHARTLCPPRGLLSQATAPGGRARRVLSRRSSNAFRAGVAKRSAYRLAYPAGRGFFAWVDGAAVFAFSGGFVVVERIEQRGQVFDESSEMPLAFVNIFIQETSKGTVTDDEGNFAFFLECNCDYEVVAKKERFVVRLFSNKKSDFDNFKPMIHKSLNALDERLDDRSFFRASRKHIINLNWVESIESWFNGGLMVVLKGGDKVEVSRRQAARFKEMMSL